ncbi:protein-L-isoaspartate O-methyltransferase [mine drainage metagenome]|uniref:protein-L-isoaspartate(D-aspartate) O-methyltransferase n=1 Tax=mine drainage metagenome TaxID=410659 RepID=A0A1J5S2C8_9ZZZZ
MRGWASEQEQGKAGDAATVPEAARARYAAEVAALSGVSDPGLLRALAMVRREDFLPPGPWLIEAADGSCYLSADADPDRILHAVGVVLDPQRGLHHANPARVARMLERAGIRPGHTVLHVGAGPGYFTALMAEMVGPSGRVIAAEIDPALAAGARQALADRPNVRVEGDALALALPRLDRIFVSCGLAALPVPWLEALAEDGRMMVPMTGAMDAGLQLQLEADPGAAALRATAVSCVMFYPCHGLRDDAAAQAFDRALAGGRVPEIRSLRRDPHAPDADCWLHGDGWCLSCAEPA